MAYDARTEVYNMLVRHGVPPQAALGGLYGLMGESGSGLDPNAFNKDDPGGSIGIGQWNGPRRRALEAHAAQMGLPVSDPRAQVSYLEQELTNPELKTYEPGVLNRLQNAPSAAAATNIWTGGFERPKVNNWQARYARGMKVASLDASGNLNVSGAVPNYGSMSGAATAGSGPMDPSIAAHGGTSTAGVVPATPAATAVASAAPAAAPVGPPKTVGEAIQRATETQTDASGKETQSPLAKVGEDLFGGQKQQQQAPQLSYLPAGGGGGAELAGPSQQMFGQVLASAAKPLSWGSAPYGSNAGQQGPPPGTTLNSNPMGYMGYPYYG